MIWYNQLVVKKQLNSKAVTVLAGPKWRVKRKQTRFNLGNGETGHGAGKFFRERETLSLTFFWRGLKNRDAIGEIKCGAKRIREPCFQPFANHNTVYNHVDVVAEFLVQFGRFIQFIEFAIDLDPREALLAKFKKLLAVFTFAVANNRGQKEPAGPLLHCHDAIDHVLHLLCFNRQTRCRRKRCANAGKQQTHIVVNFGHGADGGSRVFRCCFLFD